MPWAVSGREVSAGVVGVCARIPKGVLEWMPRGIWERWWNGVGERDGIDAVGGMAEMVREGLKEWEACSWPYKW